MTIFRPKNRKIARGRPLGILAQGLFQDPFLTKNEKNLQGNIHKTVIFIIKRKIYYGKFLAKTFFEKTDRLENSRKRKKFLSGKIVEKLIDYRSRKIVKK